MANQSEQNLRAEVATLDANATKSRETYKAQLAEARKGRAKLIEAVTTSLGNVRSLKHTHPGVKVYDEWERMLVETLTGAGVPVEAAQ